MNLHVHHMDSKMVFEKIPTHYLLIYLSGKNKPVTFIDDLSESMNNLYRGIGIFASEKPVRDTTQRIVDL